MGPVSKGAFLLLSADASGLRGLDWPVQGGHRARSGAFDRSRLSRHDPGAERAIWMDQEHARIVGRGDEPGGKQRSARSSFVVRIFDPVLSELDGGQLR